MGKKSPKLNKNIYLRTREDKGMSRLEVENETNGLITSARLEKIENDTIKTVDPGDVLRLSKIYETPELLNYYCTQACPIGREYVPVVESIHDLPQHTLQILSSLNSLNRDKERMIDISSDGVISEEEKNDFELIKVHLDEMNLAIEAFRLWVEKMTKHSKLD